jgi:hypothetical protein
MELRPECGQSTKQCNSRGPIHGPQPLRFQPTSWLLLAQGVVVEVLVSMDAVAVEVLVVIGKFPP